MEEVDGVEIKICSALLSGVLWLYGNDLTVLDIQKQDCWGSRSIECGTSSIEPAFYLNLKTISR